MKEIFIWAFCTSLGLIASFMLGAEVMLMQTDKEIRVATTKLNKCHELITRNYR